MHPPVERDDGQSHFKNDMIALKRGMQFDFLSGKIDALSNSFQQTDSGGSFEWYTAPAS
jgi:hypothetical protein